MSDSTPLLLSARALVVAWLAFLPAGALAEAVTIWVGTGGGGGSQGIYRTELDPERGTLAEPELVGEIASPGFLAFAPGGEVLYSLGRDPDGNEGGVAAWAVGEDGKSLTLLNFRATGDGGAAHLCTDRTGKVLFTAQYGGGSVAAFPLGGDGSVGPPSALVKHEGSGPDGQRQSAPHPHWVGVSPDNRFLLVPDLGTDEVVVYRIDPDMANVARHGAGKCPPGSGPRHMKFSHDGAFAWVLNELAMTVTTFRWDAGEGTLEALATVSALPDELKEPGGTHTASEIRVHPGGRFVYTANRGHDSITVFAADPESGALTLVEHEAVRGAWPRNFNLDQTGRWLVAAGANSHTLSLFEIDPGTGGLVFTQTVVNVPNPICVEFGPR